MFGVWKKRTQLTPPLGIRVKGRNMEKLLLYQKEIVENEKRMSNEELLDEVLNQATGDDYDGCFTVKGLWEYRYLEGKLRERLASWLSVQHDKRVD